MYRGLAGGKMMLPCRLTLCVVLCQAMLSLGAHGAIPAFSGAPRFSLPKETAWSAGRPRAKETVGARLGGGGGRLALGLRMAAFKHENPDLGMDDERWTTLTKWAQKSGMSWGGWKVGVAPTGIRGAIATRDIERGEVIVAAPKHATIFTQIGQKIPFPESFMSEEAWDSLDERFWNTKMALRLLYEKRLGEESAFKDYISVLPDDFTTTLFFKEQEIPELQWGPLMQTAMDDKLFYSWIYDKVIESMPEPFSQKEFFWALACAGSRTFTADFGEGEQGEIMCPIADMVNHDGQSAPAMRYREKTGLFELFSPLETPRGSEICISYGNVSNHHLLHYYGFVPDDNVYDYIPITEYELVTARDAERGDEEASSLKGTPSRVLKYLIDAGVHGLTLPLAHLKDKSRVTAVEGDAELKLGGCLSEHDAIMLYCRVLCLEDENMTLGPLEVARKLQGLTQLSERNERQAVGLLVTVLENQLDSMPTTLEFDEAIAEAGYPSMSDTVVQAVRFRVVRKRKLVEAIDAMKAKLDGMAASV